MSDLNDFLKTLGETCVASGFEAYLVGGYVRDRWLGLATPREIDIVINTNAIDFMATMPKIEIKEQFDQFGTVKINARGLEDYDIELASARTEMYKEAADFPKVTLIQNIQEDLPRRDFTINALLQSIMPQNFGAIVDHVHGKTDLEKRIIRVFHDKSFEDDPTRIYRAYRFARKLNFAIDPETLHLARMAYFHVDWQKWFDKRKNRFDIELALIQKIEPSADHESIKKYFLS